MAYCANCGQTLADEARFCANCGRPVAVAAPGAAPQATPPAQSQQPGAQPGHDEMFCWSCGAVIKKQAEICVKCGVRVAGQPGIPAQNDTAATGQASEKSRVTAGILGILLGGLGIHSFYLGQIGKGIGQIAVTVFTCGIGSIWGFIEGIIIIAGGNWKDGKGKLLRKHNE